MIHLVSSITIIVDQAFTPGLGFGLVLMAVLGAQLPVDVKPLTFRFPPVFRLTRVAAGGTAGGIDCRCYSNVQRVNFEATIDVGSTIAST